MADERLSLSIEFEELQRFQGEIQSVVDLIGGIGIAVSDASSSMNSFSFAVNEAAVALAKVAGAGVPTADPTGFQQTAGAANDAATAAKKFGQESKKATNEASDGSREAARGFSELANTIVHLPPIVQGLIGGLAGAGIFALVQKSLSQLSHTMREALHGFTEAENAITSFAIALGSLGKFSSEAIEDFEHLAKSISTTTTASKTAVIAAGAFLAQVGRLSGPQLERATKAAVDLAAVLGVDLDTASRLLAKAAQGSTVALARFGIIIDEAIPKGEKFEALLGLIEERFAGTAELKARTLSGTIEQLSKSWHGFLKAIGSSLTVFTPIIQRMTADMRTFNALLQDLGLVVRPALDAASGVDNLSKSVADFVDETARIGPITFRTEFQDEVGLANLRQRVERQIGDVKVFIEFAARGGDVEELKKQIPRLLALEVEIRPISGRMADELRRIREEASKAIPQVLELEERKALEEYRAFRRQLESERPRIEVDFLDEKVRAKILELQRQRVDILAKVDLTQLETEELRALTRRLKVVGPTLDDAKFFAEVDRVLDLFGKRWKEGIEEGSEKAKEAALLLIPALEELSRQRLIRLDASQLKEARAELEKLRKDFQLPFELAIRGHEAVESALPRVLALVQQLQETAGETFAVRIDAEAAIRGSEDATAALEAMDRALERAIAQRDLSALAALRGELASFIVEIEASSAALIANGGALDQNTAAVLENAKKQKAAIEDLLRAREPIQQAQDIERRIGVAVAAGDLAAATAGINRMRRLVEEFPGLEIPVNLRDLEESLLEIDSVRQSVELAMLGIDTAVAATVAGIKGGFKSAAEVVLQVIVDLVTDIIKQFVRLKIIERSLKGIFSGGIFSVLTQALPFLPGKFKTQPAPGEPVQAEPVTFEAPQIIVQPFEPIPVSPRFSVAGLEPIQLAPFVLSPEFSLRTIAPLDVAPEFRLAPLEPLQLEPRLAELPASRVPVPATAEIARAAFAERGPRLPARTAAAPIQVREELRARREPAPSFNVSIEALDGVSVQRQITSGAFRREIDRQIRRRSL